MAFLPPYDPKPSPYDYPRQSPGSAVPQSWNPGKGGPYPAPVSGNPYISRATQPDTVPSPPPGAATAVGVDAEALRAIARQITPGDPRDESAPLLMSFGQQYYVNTELGASVNAQALVYAVSHALGAVLTDARTSISRTPAVLLNWADAAQELDANAGNSTQLLTQLDDRARQAPGGSR